MMQISVSDFSGSLSSRSTSNGATTNRHSHAVSTFIQCCILFVGSFFSSNMVMADEGDPIAVVRGQNGIEISTFWGPALTVQAAGGASEMGIVQLGASYDHLYFRNPNESDAKWVPNSEVNTKVQNAIRIRSLGSANEKPILIEADGCKILFTNTQIMIPESAKLPKIDLLVVFVDESPDESALTTISSSDDLLQILLVPAATEADEVTNQLSHAMTGDQRKLRNVPHHTLAISSSESKNRQLYLLGSESWEMPEDMAAEFSAMEKACSDSQSVFEKLSTEQMNFKPSNGTHTPRWNAEHMMGRQLVFFSQIYNKIDPTIRVMDLNPKQNPEDYVAAHDDWTGAEEARQMQRVSQFTRRFAYLLDGVELKQRAPGSRWPTLEALLKQMDRHYAEHTANTEKKFSLPDWPK